MADEGPHLEGWIEEETPGESRTWRNSRGEVLSLRPDDTLPGRPHRADAVGFQHWARAIAEQNNAGLINVYDSYGDPGTSPALIYKQRDGSASVYTGILLLKGPESYLHWHITAREQRVTGAREAAVIVALGKAGKLTPESFLEGWAHDPYDPTYEGVESTSLHFHSDSASYDHRFPDHPLSRVRQHLRELAPGQLVEMTLDVKSHLLDHVVTELVRDGGPADLIHEVLAESGFDPTQIESTLEHVQGRPPYDWTRPPLPGGWRMWFWSKQGFAMVVGLTLCAAAAAVYALDSTFLAFALLVSGLKAFWGAAKRRGRSASP